MWKNDGRFRVKGGARIIPKNLKICIFSISFTQLNPSPPPLLSNKKIESKTRIKSKFKMTDKSSWNYNGWLPEEKS